MSDAILELRKAKKKLQEDLTTVVAGMVRSFQDDTGVGVAAIDIYLVETTTHGDLTRHYIVSNTEVDLAL